MISFYATVADVTYGGDGSRITLAVKDAAPDLGAAVGLMPLKNRVLSVRAVLGSGAEELATFRASIAPIQTGLHFRPHNVRVKLDVPETDALASARLLAYQESAIRFEIGDEGEQQPKQKPSKGDYGYFWRSLVQHGFMGHPDMLPIWTDLRERNNRPEDYAPEQLLRDCFAVASRAAISPARLKDWLRVRRLHEASGVWMLIEQAEREL